MSHQSVNMGYRGSIVIVSEVVGAFLNYSPDAWLVL